MKKLRIAQIGVGHDHAGPTMATLRLCSDIFELVGYARVPEDRKQDSSHKPMFEGVRELTLDELWAQELDAVAIETEDENLTKYALLALRKGLAVQMDKPGSQDRETFRELIDYAKAHHSVLHFGYMYRYNAALLEAERLIRSGEVGEVLCIEAQMNCIHKEKKRNWLAGYKGGMMYFLGCHLIDVVLRLQGEPKNILALNRVSGLGGAAGEDIGTAVFEYDRGGSVIRSTAVEYNGFMRRQFIICCEKATIEINPTEYYPTDDKYGEMFSDLRISYADEHGMDWMVRPPAKRYGPVDRYEAMFREFAAIARGERESPWSLDYELLLHETILRACGA